ncbi:Pre-rRNA-processing protein ESF2 [Porphyridium purpureum]|uniref:Pre-rRNA-processing protein ESF2 n=1 Tax=Porphyridium purpureum TaxID=35688 RepID=A0A5J4Z6X4_PORPP|nr:Pre-rRNA-processing protein ESF2 [Porphyridium purpureum]|eukprot:POR4891..scf295_1
MEGKAVAGVDGSESSRGVVYVSRVPPNFGPAPLRALLAKHADVLRVFLQEHDEAKGTGSRRAASRMKKQARRASFKHGWVEFTRKKDAKRVALLLNNTPMGGKRRGRYHDDLWNIKYLPGFTWSDLVDDMIQERKRKAQRVKFEIDQAAKERDFYLSRLDQAKAIESMQQRRAARATSEGEYAKRSARTEREPEQRPGRTFDHKQVDRDEALERSQVDLSLLQKLFS